MTKSQILYEMLWYIQNKKQFTAQELATEFHLSVRSVYRYITDLSEMGLYIESKQGRAGGFTVLDNQLLPPVLFLEDEIISLFFAMTSLENYQDFPFKMNTSSVKEKLLEVVPNTLKIKLEELTDIFQLATTKQTVKTPYLTELMMSALKNQQIIIDYQSQTKRSTKILNPIGIYASNGLWYLFAHDTQLCESRHYRIDRILSLEITSIEFKKEATLKDLRREYEPKQSVPLVATLTKAGANRCLENPYLAEHVIQNEDGSGKIETEISYDDIPYTAEFFLQLGVAAKVEQPIEMIEFLRNRAQDLLKLYGL